MILNLQHAHDQLPNVGSGELGWILRLHMRGFLGAEACLHLAGIHLHHADIVLP